MILRYIFNVKVWVIEEQPSVQAWANGKNPYTPDQWVRT